MSKNRPEFGAFASKIGGPRWVRRATRLALGAPIAYRSSATDQWAYGSMVDISRSGVLFVPDEAAVPDPELRLVIFLSRAALEAGGVSGLWPDLYCGGPVIRNARTVDGRQAVAIRFDYEWSQRPEDAPAATDGMTRM